MEGRAVIDTFGQSLVHRPKVPPYGTSTFNNFRSDSRVSVCRRSRGDQTRFVGVKVLKLAGRIAIQHTATQQRAQGRVYAEKEDQRWVDVSKDYSSLIELVETARAISGRKLSLGRSRSDSSEEEKGVTRSEPAGEQARRQLRRQVACKLRLSPSIGSSTCFLRARTL